MSKLLYSFHHKCTLRCNKDFLHISFCPTKIILQLEGGNRITVLQAYVRTLDNLNANLASKKIAA